MRRLLRVADVGVEPDPAVGLGEARGALGEPHRRAHADVAVNAREADAPSGKTHAQVVQVDLDAALVGRGEIARRGAARSFVEVGGALGAEAAHEDEVRLVADARVERAEGVVVDTPWRARRSSDRGGRRAGD